MNCGGLGNHVNTSLTMIAVLYRLLYGNTAFVNVGPNLEEHTA